MAIKTTGMLIRGLHEHWSRSEPGSDITNLIGTFLQIQVKSAFIFYTLFHIEITANQYSALLTYSRAPGSSIYSPSWTGPPISTMLPWGQLAAMDVLNSGIDLPTEPSSASPPSSQTQTPTSHRKIVGPIVGGVLGGIAFIGCVVAIAFFIRRWRRRVDSDETKPGAYVPPERPSQTAERGVHFPSLNEIYPIEYQLSVLPFMSRGCGGSDSPYNVRPYLVSSYSVSSSQRTHKMDAASPPQYEDAIRS